MYLNTTYARNALHDYECIRQRNVLRRHAFENPGCGTNLVCCILYALPEFLSGINNVGVNRTFMESHKKKSVVLKSGDRDGHGTTTDTTLGLIPA